MKDLKVIIGCYIVALIMLAVTFVYSGQDIKVTGVVTVGDRTGDIFYGKPETLVLVRIDDSHYDYYWVTNKTTGIELYNYIGRMVTVVGRTWREGTRQRLTVKRIIKIW